MDNSIKTVVELYKNQDIDEEKALKILGNLNKRASFLPVRAFEKPPAIWGVYLTGTSQI